MIEELKKDQDLWDLYTRREEYNSPYYDLHGRFPYYLSRNRDVMLPRVSQFLVSRGFCPEYGDGKKFAVCLTHDIDYIYPNWTRIAKGMANSFSDRDLKRLLTWPFSKVNKNYNPYWNFHKIMGIEEKFGAKSTFFIMTAERDPAMQIYPIGDLAGDMRDIVRRGWDIGLHGGYYSYNDAAAIAEEKRKLERAIGKKVIGYRNHFLKFCTPDTWLQLEKAGFSYDSTLGFADCIGFRNGMCHPFRPYDLKGDRWIDLVEIPQAIMDGTLFEYMRLNCDDSWKMVREIIDTVEKYQGVVTLSWHNTQSTDVNLSFYEKVLKYCYDKGALMTSADTIYQLSKTIGYV